MLVAADWHYATPMLSAAYVDMPCLAKTPDGLVAALTYNLNAAEGGQDQHVAVVRSADGGTTWSAPIDLEPANYPESSWATAWYDAINDRLYAFYVYNHDNVRRIEENDGTGATYRVDSIGRICYKVSLDRGLTWGARQYVPPLPVKAIDQRNPFGGTKQLLWLFGAVQSRGPHIFISFAKMGTYLNGQLFGDTEAFLLRASIQPDGLSNFTTLPSGTDGIRAPEPFWAPGSGPTKITEEAALLLHDDGLISVYPRTDRGRLYEARSSDGSTFTGDWARQSDGTKTIYHNRGPAMVAELPDGRFFLMTYNHGGTGFMTRNPVWYRLGERVGDRVLWGEPAALIYHHDMQTPIGYASVVFDGDDMVIAASDKSSARLLRFPLCDL